LATEFQLIRADGTVAWVSVVAARFTDAEGNNQGFLGSLTDITLRKQSEASEREANARLRQLVDGVRGVPWEASTGPWRVTFVGGEGQRKLGYTDDLSLEDGHWFAHLHPDDALGVLDLLNQKVANAEPEFELNYRIITIDQRVRWIRDLVKIVPSASGAPVMRGLAIDVTESKAAEEVAEQAREDLERRVEQRTAQLSRRNRELREFTYALAHDIKVPLRGVSNLADWLVRDYRDALGTEGQRLCRLLDERVQFMHQFVDGILDYTRIGHETIENAPVALGEIVPHVVEMLAPPDHIRVVVPDDLPVVNGQAEHLLRVFQNLIGNAINYLDKPAGEITVQADRLNSAWQFTVADNGPGIPERYHGKLFQLFQPLPNSNGRKGTGVGLAIVKQIIERRGGTISLLSRDGEGSSFQFTWPDQPPTSDHHPAE
jgi:signal transduction histidine kinase